MNRSQPNGFVRSRFFLGRGLNWRLSMVIPIPIHTQIIQTSKSMRGDQVRNPIPHPINAVCHWFPWYSSEPSELVSQFQSGIERTFWNGILPNAWEFRLIHCSQQLLRTFVAPTVVVVVHTGALIRRHATISQNLLSGSPWYLYMTMFVYKQLFYDLKSKLQ